MAFRSFSVLRALGARTRARTLRMLRRGVRSRAARRAAAARFAHPAETERQPANPARREARAFVSIAKAQRLQMAKSKKAECHSECEHPWFSAATLLDYHASDDDGVMDERRFAPLPRAGITNLGMRLFAVSSAA